MNRKGFVGAGNVLIALVVLSFVLMGGYTIYANFVGSYGFTPDETIASEINALYANTTALGYSAQNESESVSTQFDSGDNVFIRGSKVLNTIGASGTVAVKSLDVAQKGSAQLQLPQEMWDTLIIIITLIIIFAVASALWRYELLK